MLGVQAVPAFTWCRTRTLFPLSLFGLCLYPWCGAWWCACSGHCLWSPGTYSTVIFVDTSATDTDPEEPANALASLGRKPVQPKPKGSKQRRVSKAGARLLKTGRLAKSQQLKREKKLKLTKKEKENMKDLKKQKVSPDCVPVLASVLERCCTCRQDSLAYEAFGLPSPTRCKVRLALSIPLLGCCQGCCLCQWVKGFWGLFKKITVYLLDCKF